MKPVVPTQADSYDELVPLIDHCKAGRLFAVQEWIADGKSIVPPPSLDKRSHKRSPVEWAVSLGFHSLLEVLLRAGAANVSNQDFCLMCMALESRRLDMVELLVEHGFDPKSVSMFDVFASWEPEIMEFFIDRGADVETGNPLAYALCHKIRTALRILKRYGDQFPSFQEQANIALRHHSKEGSVKWVSLMLWAGADPFAVGECEYDAEPDEDDEGLSAIEYAALWGHFDVLAVKKMNLKGTQAVAAKILKYCDESEGFDLAKRLLSQGLDPNDQSNGGCSAIHEMLTRMQWRGASYYWFDSRRSGNFDTERGREQLKMIHLLAQHGGRWIPEEPRQINDVRRSLLKMTAEYTVEFIWIMEKYRACSKTDIEILLRTPTIKRHTAEYRQELGKILSRWTDDEETTESVSSGAIDKSGGRTP
jgi:hypothetical protein